MQRMNGLVHIQTIFMAPPVQHGFRIATLVFFNNNKLEIDINFLQFNIANK